MSPTSSASATKSGAALLLTFVAGYVDIVGYLTLYRVFTANMTGNTVHLAEHLTQARWPEAALFGYALLFFLVGSLLGRATIEVGARNRVRAVASLTLSMEAALIALVMALFPSNLTTSMAKWLLAALAAALGIQTATLTRIGPLTVHTTFVTGMINKFAQLLSHGLFLSYDALAGRKQARAARQLAFRRAAFMASIWLFYFSGAAVGGVLDLAHGIRALLVPIALLGAAILVDRLLPLSLQEEEDQIHALQ